MGELPSLINDKITDNRYGGFYLNLSRQYTVIANKVSNKFIGLYNLNCKIKFTDSLCYQVVFCIVSHPYSSVMWLLRVEQFCSLVN